METQKTLMEWMKELDALGLSFTETELVETAKEMVKIDELMAKKAGA